MIELIKKNASFLLVYLVFAIGMLIFILTNGKQEAQLWANQFHSPFFDGFFFYSTKIVEWFALVVILFILLFKGARFAIIGVVIYGISALLIRMAKITIFDTAMRPTFNNDLYRLIPEEYGMTQLSNNSFPSGHTTAGFTLFCFLTLISVNKKWGYVFGVIAAIVAYSRVYLSQHFFEDILAGSTIGTILTLVLFFYLIKINFGAWAHKPLINRK